MFLTNQNAEIVACILLYFLTTHSCNFSLNNLLNIDSTDSFTSEEEKKQDQEKLRI